MLEERSQRRTRRIDEIAEHVHVTAVGDGADLDATHQLHPGVPGGDPSFFETSGRVVVGDAENGKARSAGLEDELRRRQCAVGGGRVKVKVYQVRR